MRRVLTVEEVDGIRAFNKKVIMRELTRPDSRPNIQTVLPEESRRRILWAHDYFIQGFSASKGYDTKQDLQLHDDLDDAYIGYHDLQHILSINTQIELFEYCKD